MGIFKNIKEWNARSKAEAESDNRATYDAKARADVQPMVWNGKMWLAVKGEPIVEVKDLNGDLLAIVENAQVNLSEFRWKQNKGTK